MAMHAGVRTPAEVIAIALEDEGIAPDAAKKLSHRAAERLSVALRSLSKGDTTLVIYSPSKKKIEWANVPKP